MTQAQQMPLFPPRSVKQLVDDVEKLTQEIQDLYCSDEIPWILGVSFGKDSSAVLQLIWYAIAALPLEKRTKTIHLITTDTLVENPIISTWVRNCIKQVKLAANQQQMPVEPHLLHPSVQETFWVCLMGKGYPAPRNGFRWCTDRMKIQPVNHFIREMVRVHGETIVVLGTRKAESSKRAATMNKHEAGRLRERLSPNARLPNSLIYSPIEDWRNDEVWIYLNQWQNPWGYSNKDLFTMYRGATADSECPLVVDTSTPSCGDSRFGCWVCTMVNQDKSMEAMIQNDEEKEWMQPLLDIRNELDIENDRPKRDFRRIYGRVELFERNVDGETSTEPIPGPYTKYWREHWLRRVLEAQTQVRRTAPPEMRDITLITHEELSEIRRIWLEEKHEFDDSLPRIYEEVTGEPFQDSRPSAERKLLGSDEWTVLKEICEDEMHLELMARLLDTENQFHAKSRRGIYESLDKCFESSSRSRDEAIDNAHFQRNVKNTVKAVKDDTAEIHDLRQAFEKSDRVSEAVATLGASELLREAELPPKRSADRNEGKQLSWASLKFSAKNSDEENSDD